MMLDFVNLTDVHLTQNRSYGNEKGSSVSHSIRNNHLREIEFWVKK